MKFFNYSLFLVLFFIGSFSSLADEEFDFGEEVSIGGPKENEKKDFSLGGNLSFKMGHQIGNPKRWMDLGPSLKLKGSLQKHWGTVKVDFDSEFNFAFKIEDDDQDLAKDSLPTNTLREFFWQKSFGKQTFKIGKKIVVWGKADALVVTDVLTPKDLSLLFFTDIEKARIGQFLLEWDLYLEKIEMNVYVIPYPLYNKSPEQGHPYGLPKALTLKNRAAFSKSKQDPELALRINRQWEWGSTAFLLASLHNRDPLMIMENLFTYKETHRRYFFTGLTSNIAFKNFLLKAEIAYEKDKPLQAQTNIVKKDFLSSMIGFDYNHTQRGNWVLEYSVTGPLQQEDSLTQKDWQHLVLFSWSKNFLHEDLNLNLGLTFYDDLKNTLFSLNTRYHFNDSWQSSLSFTMIDFKRPLSTLPFSNFNQFDRVDLSLKYSF